MWIPIEIEIKGCFDAGTSNFGLFLKFIQIRTKDWWMFCGHKELREIEEFTWHKCLSKDNVADAIVNHIIGEFDVSTKSRGLISDTFIPLW